EELDPVSPLMCMTPGMAFFCAHAYDDALEQFQKVVELEPNFLAARSLLGHVYEQKCLYDQAVGEYSRLIDVVGSESVPGLSLKAAIGRLEAKRGRESEARKIAIELSESQHTRILAYVIAQIYAALGENDQAFELLNQAYNDRNFSLVSSKVDPNLDPVRKDQRFSGLLELIGLSKFVH